MGLAVMRQTKRNWTILPTIAFLVLLVPQTLSTPVPVQSSSSDVTSEDAWLLTSEGSEKRSHLLMWMMTEKQLIPRVQALAVSATALLRCTCAEEGKLGMEECLALGASLPAIPGLCDVPSQTVLHNENKRSFVKTLLANAYTSLKEVEGVLRREVTPAGLGTCRRSHGARYLLTNMQAAAAQFDDMLTSFYKRKMSDPGAVTVSKDNFTNERLLAIKLLYVAVDHLKEVSAALEYSVQFSWFSRLTASIQGRGRFGGWRKNWTTKGRQ